MYIGHIPFCSSSDELYLDNKIGHIESSLKQELNCYVKDLKGLILGYWKNQIDCTSHFEEWFSSVASPRIFDMNRCHLNDYELFFDVEPFADYLRNKSLPKESLPNMLISGECNLLKAMEDYWRARDFDQSNIFFDR
ncbi:hypothetical protein RF11_01277 [Thelohanellus kitauei]|uniref:Uncharacterized protein n=1 Tax=Thelohanellus kitauei TaxID=669202 RepID=A0A0C2JN95_THEKT|nr:hypothetical protein RF11_01277 [Thelohanellus kitauei]